MLRSKRVLVLTSLVTVFGCFWTQTWCASLMSSKSNNVTDAGETSHWNPRSLNHTERHGRQYSSASNHISSSNTNNNYFHNANLNGGDSQSSFSITPSMSYQFYTNDHEHLDGIVQAHQQQNLPVNSFDVGEGSRDSDGVVSAKISSSSGNGDSAERRSDVVTDLPRTSIVYPGNFYSYDHHSSQSQGKWESKQKQQQQQFFSDPRAISGNKYLSQREQVGELQDNGTGFSKPTLAVYPTQSATVKHSYSRLPENHDEAPNGTPITHQGQHPQVHTAASYFPAQERADASTARSMPVEGKAIVALPREMSVRKPEGKRQILQRRDDSYGVAEQGGQEDAVHHHYYDHGDESQQYEQSQQGEAYDHDHNHEHDHEDAENEYYFGGNGENDQEAVEEDPALRDFGDGHGGFGGGPGGVGVGVGAPQPPGLPPPIPGIPGPVPPPPGPLKGSIDYILIPLILIGLAGPIFVVLYVILGGFEYRLAPIVRRSLETSYTDYQPYIDSVTSTVGRALEKYECSDYAICRVKGFCNKLGLEGSTANSIEQVLGSVTPKEYMSSLSSVFSVLKRPAEEENCSQYKCSSLVNQLPVKF